MLPITADCAADSELLARSDASLEQMLQQLVACRDFVQVCNVEGSVVGQVERSTFIRALMQS